MEGEDEKSEDNRSFSKASIPKRIAIVVAGALGGALGGGLGAFGGLGGSLGKNPGLLFPPSELLSESLDSLLLSSRSSMCRPLSSKCILTNKPICKYLNQFPSR